MKIKAHKLPRNLELIIFLSLVLLELLVIKNLSDLPITLANWEPKAKELLNFKVPSDNFYGPGSALMLIPFLWSGPEYFVPVLFYALTGFYFYFKLAERIENRKFRLFALALPLINVYLFWLFITSQDTVFEFVLFMSFAYFFSRNNWLRAILFGVLLAETRSGYWAVIMGGVVTLYLLSKVRKSNFNKKSFLILPAYMLISILNFINYGSTSPALEGGLTAYFSYAKHHYLSLPKFDMDVFLSGPNGDFSNLNLNQDLTKAKTEVEVDRIYYRYALDSLKTNPKEAVLGWMQKFESHLISIQKVPNLPGRYVYDSKTNSIIIKDERLTWPLIAGYLSYEIYRFLLIVLGLISIGLFLSLKYIHKKIDLKSLDQILVFWIFSIVPAMLFYSETRFKIVQEISLIPLILLIWNLHANSKSKLISPSLQ